MPTLTPSELTAQLHWRYATKQFDPLKKISAELWSALEASMVLTPSSFGLQPWKFIVITDSRTKEKLKAASWNQSQVLDCSHHIVIAAKKELSLDDIDKLIARTSQLRGTPLEKLAGYQGVMQSFRIKGYMTEDWAIRQCYIALGQLMSVAAILGVDACPMEGFEPAKVDEILGLSREGYVPAICCSLGYRTEGDKYAQLPKVRFSKEEMVRLISEE